MSSERTKYSGLDNPWEDDDEPENTEPTSSVDTHLCGSTTNVTRIMIEIEQILLSDATPTETMTVG